MDSSSLFIFVYLFEPWVVQCVFQIHPLLGIGDKQPMDQVFGLAADRLPMEVVEVVYALDCVVGYVFTEFAVKGKEAPQPRCRLRRT